MIKNIDEIDKFFGDLSKFSYQIFILATASVALATVLPIFYFSQCQFVSVSLIKTWYIFKKFGLSLFICNGQFYCIFFTSKIVQAQSSSNGLKKHTQSSSFLKRGINRETAITPHTTVYIYHSIGRSLQGL